MYAAETHGALQNAAGTLANLKGVLTRDDIDFRQFQQAVDQAMLRLDLDDVVPAGEKLRLRVQPSEGAPRVKATLTPLGDAGAGAPMETTLKRDAEAGWQAAEFDLTPGVWRVTVHAEGATPVTDLAVVAHP